MYKIAFLIGRAVAQFRAGFQAGTNSLFTDARRAAVYRLIVADPKENYIPAIKQYRNEFGATLKEAKDAVDAMRDAAGMQR